MVFSAKTAAHKRADDPDLLIFKAQTGRRLIAVSIGNLAAHVDRWLVVDRRDPAVGGGVKLTAKVSRVVAGRYADGALRLQESVLGSWGAVGSLDNHIGLGKTGL